MPEMCLSFWNMRFWFSIFCWNCYENEVILYICFVSCVNFGIARVTSHMAIAAPSVSLLSGCLIGATLSSSPSVSACKRLKGQLAQLRFKLADPLQKEPHQSVNVGTAFTHWLQEMICTTRLLMNCQSVNKLHGLFFHPWSKKICSTEVSQSGNCISLSFPTACKLLFDTRPVPVPDLWKEPFILCF